MCVRACGVRGVERCGAAAPGRRRGRSRAVVLPTRRRHGPLGRRPPVDDRGRPRRAGAAASPPASATPAHARSPTPDECERVRSTASRRRPSCSSCSPRAASARTRRGVCCSRPRSAALLVPLARILSRATLRARSSLERTIVVGAGEDWPARRRKLARRDDVEVLGFVDSTAPRRRSARPAPAPRTTGRAPRPRHAARHRSRRRRRSPRAGEQRRRVRSLARRSGRRSDRCRPAAVRGAGRKERLARRRRSAARERRRPSCARSRAS